MPLVSMMFRALLMKCAQIIYPISPRNLQKLQTTFLHKLKLAIENLTLMLQQDHLTNTQWEDAQYKLQKITNFLNQCIEQTCMAKPTLPLPYRVKIQRGFFPQTQKMKTSIEITP